MATISVEEAQLKFNELIDQPGPGQELVITRDSQPVARLIGERKPKGQPIAGRGKGKLIILPTVMITWKTLWTKCDAGSPRSACAALVLPR